MERTPDQPETMNNTDYEEETAMMNNPKQNIMDVTTNVRAQIERQDAWRYDRQEQLMMQRAGFYFE